MLTAVSAAAQFGHRADGPSSSSAPANAQTFAEILLLLSEIAERVQREETEAAIHTTALLRQTVALVAQLSVAVVVPESASSGATSRSPSSSTQLTAAPRSYTRADPHAFPSPDEADFDFLGDDLSGSSSHSTRSSPSELGGASPLPSLHLHDRQRTPDRRNIAPPAQRGSALLTPPPSAHTSKITDSAFAIACSASPTSSNGGGRPSDAWAGTLGDLSLSFGGLSGLGGGSAGPLVVGGRGLALQLQQQQQSQALMLPIGFQNATTPEQSNGDFHLRATFHRSQGRGIPEAYEQTLRLSGSTVIDGVCIAFRITDAYFNPETYNYSESLCRIDGSGITGYRYDNRNGSTYIRFDEPTGPRIAFTRHAHPPFSIPGPSVSLHSADAMKTLRAPPPPFPSQHLPPMFLSPAPTSSSMARPFLPRGLSSSSTSHASRMEPPRLFSVQDLWN